MRIIISGIPIDVQKKNIKNMHLLVKPPDGHVAISAPKSVDDEAIKMYARTQLGFIKRSIAKFQSQPRASKRQYVSGETIYIWGKPYYLIFKADSQKNHFLIQNQNVILTMNDKSTVKQRESYVREEYRKILKEAVKKRLPLWEEKTGLKCDSWQIKYMVTKWGACNTEKRKLWFNLQLAQKTPQCLDYIILHELTHLITRKHDATFTSHLDRYMPEWLEIRKTLNDSRLDYYEAHDESPLQKLINRVRYDDIKDAALAYLRNAQEVTDESVDASDITIETVTNIMQQDDGVIGFDVIVSCAVEKNSSTKSYFIEKWLRIHCQVTVGIELGGFQIIRIGNCDSPEEEGPEKLSGELVPIISREQFDEEAEKFLLRYCSEALEHPMCTPIYNIAEELMGLTIVDNMNLSSELIYFGTIVFDEGNIFDRHRKFLIRNAKRGTVYLDPRVTYERSAGTLRTTLAHECFHWYRHQPYHTLMKMIGAKDNIGRSIQCEINAKVTDSDRWRAVDWMEWQAKGIAPKILMPAKTVKQKADELLTPYGGAVGAKVESYEAVIDALATFYEVSRRAAKSRLIELGYIKAEGAYPFSNGRYLKRYSFDIECLAENQTFTISYTDLFKAYSFDNKFRELLNRNQFLYVDGHLVLNREKYVTFEAETGKRILTEYALSHMHECCLVFTKGYSYQSKYQGVRYYTQFMHSLPPQESQREYSFELNEHNQSLIQQIENATQRVQKIRKYADSMGETLVSLQNEKNISNKQLSDRSLVGEKTIQRIRNDEEYHPTLQTVLGLCFGLKLPPPEAEMFLEKAGFQLNRRTPDEYIYMCILNVCMENSIFEVNEILEKNGVKPLGSDPEISYSNYQRRNKSG